MATGLGWATDGESVAQRHVGVSSLVNRPAPAQSLDPSRHARSTYPPGQKTVVAAGMSGVWGNS